MLSQIARSDSHLHTLASQPAHRARKENSMKNSNAVKNQTLRHILLTACVAALAMAFMVALPQPAHADDVTPPPVPHNIQVPKGNVAFLEGHGVGTQNYICLPADSGGVAFKLFTPQATLFDDVNGQVTTHFFSPNPFENSTIRVTWQHSQDTSTIWAKLVDLSSNPGFVAEDAVAWLLLEVVGAQDGPTGGATLTATTFVQRLNTSGGLAPSTGCASPTDIGKQAFVPYTADYFFFRNAGSD
jgi:hypothetical protein